MPDIMQTFQEILNGPESLANLRREMIELRLEGHSKPEIYAMLESLRAHVDDAQEDIVLEAMDILVGFCRVELTI